MKRGKSYPVVCVPALLLIALVLALLTSGCYSASSARSSSKTSVAQSTSQEHTYGPGLPPLQPSALRGPANFLLRTPLDFSSVTGSTTSGNGETTRLNATVIKDGINDEFKHLLFIIDSNERVNVYTPGASDPTTAQITQNTDGSTALTYTQTTSSEAGSFTLLFNGVFVKDHISAIYEQQYSPLLISSAAASDVTVAFTTDVRWITTSEIPAAPTSGTSRITSKGGIALSWGAGQRSVAYAVYRLIPTRDQQFQWLATVRGLSYTDNSPEAIHNAHATSGITYAIFSLGPTGVENPSNIVIPV